MERTTQENPTCTCRHSVGIHDTGIRQYLLSHQRPETLGLEESTLLRYLRCIHVLVRYHTTDTPTWTGAVPLKSSSDAKGTLGPGHFSFCWHVEFAF